MILKRYIGTATVVCSLTLGLAAPALADNVSMDTTGPGSTQEVDIQNSNEVVTTNTNVVQVTNTSTQTATTGNVSADKNTSVGGGLGSGNATNNNGTVTNVGVTNDTAAVLPVGGSGEGTGTTGTPNVGGAGQGTGSVATTTGSVLGAATVGGRGAGVATLPEVGAKLPVDVSALRAAWQPQSATAPTTALAKGSHWLTGAMLVTATLLGLLGALGSALYNRRQERV